MQLVTQALQTGDWPLYQTLFHLPTRIVPREGRAYVITTLDELYQDMSLYHSAVLTDRITDIVRSVLSVDVLGEGHYRIAARIQMLSGAFMVTPPFRTDFEMVDSPEGLRIKGVESALGHIRWTLGEGALNVFDAK